MARNTGTDEIPYGHVYKGTEVSLISILLNIGSLTLQAFMQLGYYT